MAVNFIGEKMKHAAKEYATKECGKYRALGAHSITQEDLEREVAFAYRTGACEGAALAVNQIKADISDASRKGTAV